MVEQGITGRVSAFSAKGDFLGTVGAPGGGRGQLNRAWSLAVSGQGLLYVADTGNHRVQVLVAPTGRAP